MKKDNIIHLQIEITTTGCKVKKTILTLHSYDKIVDKDNFEKIKINDKKDKYDISAYCRESKEREIFEEMEKQIHELSLAKMQMYYKFSFLVNDIKYNPHKKLQDKWETRSV
jgi:hypothetical protein